jgi:hypothetical protein
VSRFIGTGEGSFPHRPSSLVFAVALAGACLFEQFMRVLRVGNIDVVLLFLWVVGVFLLGQGRVAPSALCFALGTAIKVSPVYALPLLALRRQWRWLGWYAVWSVALLLVSGWGAGWQNQLVWTRQVAPLLSNGIKYFENRSLAGFILALGDPHRLLTFLPGPPVGRLFSKALCGLCYAAFLYGCWRKQRDSRGLLFELMLLPLVVLVVSPISWPSHYVVAIFPLVCLWLGLRPQNESESKWDLILLTGGTLMLGARFPEWPLAWAAGAPGQLAIMAAWVTAPLAILWVGMRRYGGC